MEQKQETKSQVEIINAEINRELSTESVGRALLATTFKGLSATSMKQAMLEGMLRGYTFKDFLERNVYAVPFKEGYSLITSIDRARKIGMRSGIVGKDAPSYEMSPDGKKLVACSVTVKRKVSEHIGDFTATVYFDEYSTGRNLWISKPRTMLAKVAEMHALRMACPEELSKEYIEEEFEMERAGIRVPAEGPAVGKADHLPPTHVAAKPAPERDPEKCKAGKHHVDFEDENGDCSECLKEKGE
jgi:hypothetical protein